MVDPVFSPRDLISAHGGGVTVLSCIGWPDPVGGMGLRVFCQMGTDARSFVAKPGPGFANFSQARAINGGVMLVGTNAIVDSRIKIALNEGEIVVPVTAPEMRLFKGHNVCIAERNGEPLEVIAGWATYHRAQFGLESLLVFDREKSKYASDFRRELEEWSETSELARVVHLSADVPLGHPKLPAAQHPFNAPDAPGKDRMGVPDADPWRAPLAEAQIYELLKWRFLSGARAVMNLDFTDLLQPGTDPFTQVHQTSSGVVQLTGERIFPWRVRPKSFPQFGDHICRPFEALKPNRRWCVAPAKLGPDKTWRYVRIVDAAPDPAVDVRFWRAMAIRHPDASAAELVPKSSLIEDPQLLDMARNIWAHKPVRPPASKMAAVPKAATDAGRTLIVTCMKNEGPFILEWIAYHRAIGVDDFLVYTNDCDDGTDELLNALMDRGIVQRRDNRFHGTKLKPQHWALDASEKESVLKKAGWVISMDVDEFINIHVGDGRLLDLYAAIGEANMISLTWRLFGNADVRGYEDRFLVDQFTRCAPELCRKPHQAWGFKTLFRNLGIYKKMGVHRPKGLKPDLWDRIKWVNGSGQPMPAKLMRNGWRSTTDSYGYDLVTLNHYAVRSAESFLVKRDRGRVNHVDRDQGLGYWFRMNNNWQQDRSILTKRDMLQAEFDRLMADKELAALHAISVTNHRAKIAALRATENYAKFYAELTGDRMERLSRMHSHFGANVFLSGPEVVPDEIAFGEELPPDFFFTVEREKTTH